MVKTDKNERGGREMAERIFPVSLVKKGVEAYQECSACREAMLKKLSPFMIHGGVITEEELKGVISSSEIRQRVINGLSIN